MNLTMLRASVRGACRSPLFAPFLYCATAAFIFATFDASANEPNVVKAVPVEKATLAGRGLQGIPPYKKEVTLVDFQKQSVKEIFSGAFSLFVIQTKDGGTLKLDNYPFDQFAQVIKGKTTLTARDGSRQTFVAGDSFVIPKGFTGEWMMSKGFRQMSIVEARQVQEGIKQFEAEPPR